jgi:hypothetical protein
MDLHQHEALLVRTRAAHETARDLAAVARVLRSECAEHRLERAEARQRLAGGRGASGFPADGEQDEHAP